MPHRARNQPDLAIEEHHHYNQNHQQPDHHMGTPSNVSKCCKPSGCALEEMLQMDDLSDCIKVICNNEGCQEGRYMHRECFEEWEESVLTYLRSTGRARSWSEKQRLQNLWTKKGYDLAYKACGCKCGKGHLKKDLDWIPPTANPKEDQNKKRKNRRKKCNDKPTLIVSTSATQAKHHTGFINANHHVSSGNNNGSGVSGDTNGTGTTGMNGNNIHQNNVMVTAVRIRTSSISSTGSGNSGGTSPPISGSESQSPAVGESTVGSFKKYLFGDQLRRERHGSGSIFSRRQDYSSFSSLPRHKLNPYHIKMEDDVNHGNDDTHSFILSILSANGTYRTSCIVCHSSMIIFDRYPLIDGTFFLSPKQHSKSALPYVTETDRPQYLNAVCMGCLEGWNVSLECKGCKTKWDGSHLILGSMYSYDIFAAVPCCIERLRCNNCSHLVIPPGQRLEFFSDYSHRTACSHCGIVDHHFVKPLQVVFNPRGRD